MLLYLHLLCHLGQHFFLVVTSKLRFHSDIAAQSFRFHTWTEDKPLNGPFLSTVAVSCFLSFHFVPWFDPFLWPVHSFLSLSVHSASVEISHTVSNKTFKAQNYSLCCATSKSHSLSLRHCDKLYKRTFKLAASCCSICRALFKVSFSCLIWSSSLSSSVFSRTLCSTCSWVQKTLWVNKELYLLLPSVWHLFRLDINSCIFNTKL